MKTLIGFALGTLLSVGAVASASPAGMSARAPALVPDAGIEVIVVTAQRPAMQPIDAAQPIDEFIVTAKRPVKTDARRTLPASPLEMPKVELAVAAPPVVRL